MSQLYICHYSEIGLKGKNRIYFEKALAGNIKKAVKREFSDIVLKIENLNKRLVLRFDKDMDNERIYNALSTVFGLANFSAAISVEKDLQAISAACVQLMKDQQGKTFAVKAKRSDKNFPYTSPEINQYVGAEIVKRYGNKVDLSHAQTKCHIELLADEVFVFLNKEQGPGGLPVGSSGKVLALLSGGFDSPVAAYYIMKRGAHCSFLHFHVYPHTRKESQEKVKNLARILNKFQYKSRIYMVPFADTQLAIAQHCPEKFRIILYRRMMMRIAKRLADQHNYKAVVTGESVGQVASQTLDNLRVIEEVIDYPVIRPLVGFDKNEIIEKARQIDTYDISVLPHDDACTRFTPKHPVIYSRPEEVRFAEKDLDVDSLVERDLKNIEVIYL